LTNPSIDATLRVHFENAEKSIMNVRHWIVVLAALAGTSAQAAQISNGAYAGAFVRDCRSLGNTGLAPDLCIEGDNSSFVGTLTSAVADGQFGGFRASIATTDPLGIVGGKPTQSTVDASGADDALVLKLGALSAEPYVRVSGQSKSLQSFFFDGRGPADRVALGAIDFKASDLVDGNGFDAATTTPASRVNAWISVFSLPTATFDYVHVSPGSLPDFYGQAMAVPGFQGEGFAVLDFAGIGLDGDTYRASWQLDFEVQAGRYYFVETYLGVFAKFGATLDATQTFMTKLGLTEDGMFVPSLLGLAPAAPLDRPFDLNMQPIPEPASALLFAAGLTVILAARRTRRCPG